MRKNKQEVYKRVALKVGRKVCGMCGVLEAKQKKLQKERIQYCPQYFSRSDE